MSKSKAGASFSGLAGWVLFDWAAQPFYTLILTFIFAPYFAVAVIGDAVKGQEVWGYLTALAGLIVAFGGPVIGAIADANGPRKPWIGAFSVLLITSLALLWLAAPGLEHLMIVGGAVVAALVAVEFATIFTNAMMPRLVAAGHLGRLSGFGWAVGYLGGLVSLALMLGFIVTDPLSGKTLLGARPLFAFEGVERAGDRLSGPLVALWYGIFVIPLFLFTPDEAKRDKVKGKGAALGKALADLWRTLRSLSHLPPLGMFLLARMAYADGLAALFAFGGIYAAGLFGWGATQLGLFGILLTITGVIGAVAGGVLDDLVGAKRVIIGALVCLLLATIGILSIDRQSVLFVIEAPLVTGDEAVFSSLGERVYLGLGALIGLVAGPLQAASRSLLARMAPPDEMTQFFGLFAFSGKITAFMAPFLIALVTGVTQSQRAGVAVIIGFLLIGLALMARVRAR